MPAISQGLQAPVQPGPTKDESAAELLGIARGMDFDDDGKREFARLSSGYQKIMDQSKGLMPRQREEMLDNWLNQMEGARLEQYQVQNPALSETLPGRMVDFGTGVIAVQQPDGKTDFKEIYPKGSPAQGQSQEMTPQQMAAHAAGGEPQQGGSFMSFRPEQGVEGYSNGQLASPRQTMARLSLGDTKADVMERRDYINRAVDNLNQQWIAKNPVGEDGKQKEPPQFKDEEIVKEMERQISREHNIQRLLLGEKPLNKDGSDPNIKPGYGDVRRFSPQAGINHFSGFGRNGFDPFGNGGQYGEAPQGQPAAQAPAPPPEPVSPSDGQPAQQYPPPTPDAAPPTWDGDREVGGMRRVPDHEVSQREAIDEQVMGATFSELQKRLDDLSQPTRSDLKNPSNLSRLKATLNEEGLQNTPPEAIFHPYAVGKLSQLGDDDPIETIAGAAADAIKNGTDHFSTLPPMEQKMHQMEGTPVIPMDFLKKMPKKNLPALFFDEKMNLYRRDTTEEDAEKAARSRSLDATTFEWGPY